MRARRLLQILLVLGGLGGAVLIAPAQSGARVFVSPFRLFSRAAVGTSGRYTVLSRDLVEGGTVVDELARQRVRVPAVPGNCSFGVGLPELGGGWLTQACDFSVDVYRLPSGPWRQMPSQACMEQVLAPGMGTCAELGVGAHWIQYQLGCYHCVPSYVYENVETGAERSIPPSPNIVVDLNAPGLTRAPCRPLHVPADSDTVPYPGPLVLDGRYAVARGRGDSAYLETCRSTKRVRLGRSVELLVTTPHLIMWQATSSNPSRFDGMLLPSRRRFSTHAPAAITAVFSLVAGAKYIYLYGLDQARESAAWRMQWPTLPPSRPTTRHAQERRAHRPAGSADQLRTLNEGLGF
jgi:hypothetical protein